MYIYVRLHRDLTSVKSLLQYLYIDYLLYTSGGNIILYELRMRYKGKRRFKFEFGVGREDVLVY